MTPLEKAVAEVQRKFHEHIDNAIAENLRLGYRGELFCWVDTPPPDAGIRQLVTGETFKWTFHAARKPPVGEDGRYLHHVLRFDLSDEAKAQEVLKRKPRPTGGGSGK